MTSETEARRSVAITGAPRSRSTPSTIAVSPSSWIWAPSRASSCTCMNRFSKIVSVMRDVPSRACHQRHELRLQIGRETGEGRSLDVDGVDPGAVPLHPHAAVVAGHRRAGLLKRFQQAS